MSVKHAHEIRYASIVDPTPSPCKDSFCRMYSVNHTMLLVGVAKDNPLEPPVRIYTWHQSNILLKEWGTLELLRCALVPLPQRV